MEAVSSRSSTAVNLIREAISCHQIMAGQYVSNAGKLFDVMDTTGNGSLHRIEFLESMKSLNLELTETQINDMFDSMDKDSDNAIEKVEFVKLVSGSPTEETTTTTTTKSPKVIVSSNSELEFWDKMKTVISHTPSMMHEHLSTKSAKKVYSVSKLVRKRTIGSDRSVLEGLLSRVVHNNQDMKDLGGVNQKLVHKYLHVLAAVSKDRLKSKRMPSVEEIRSLKLSAKKHLKHFERKKEDTSSLKKDKCKKKQKVHTASSLFLPSEDYSDERDYLQAFVESLDTNVTASLLEKIVRSRERSRIEEETSARFEKRKKNVETKKKKKRKDVIFELHVEKTKSTNQDEESNYVGYIPPKPSSRKEFKEEFHEWMRSLGGGLDKFISQYTYKLGARSLQDIADFMSDESTIRSTMTMLNEKQIKHFVNAVKKLKDKLRGSGQTCEIVGRRMVSMGDFVFFPNSNYQSQDHIKRNRWWPKCWIARVMDTRYEDHHNLCLLRLYSATVDNIKQASKGIFYAPTNHTFQMHGRVLLGPIRLREIPSINAWELIDDISLEDNDNLEAWTPMPISSVMPSFEQCVVTLANKADTTFLFRVLLAYQEEAKKISKDQRARDIMTALRDALELEGLKYAVMDSRTIQYSGELKSLPRKFQSSVLSQIKNIKPGSTLHSFGVRVFVPSSSIENDPDAENMTLQELSSKMLQRLVAQKSASAFEEFAMSTLLSVEQPDVEKATFQSDTSESDSKYSDADAMIPLFPTGSFVYCANPQYEPDSQIRDEATSQGSPFILGRVKKHQMGVYRLKVFRSHLGGNGEYLETEDYVAVQEMALKPVPNFVSDFSGRWHCMDELNPLVFALDKTCCSADSTIKNETSAKSGSRLRIGPSILESHVASHIEGSASFRVKTF